MANFDLRKEDFFTKTWSRLTQGLELRLQELRELNDSKSHSIEQTMWTRGQINMVKEILALSKDSASQVGELDNHLPVTPSDWQP